MCHLVCIRCVTRFHPGGPKLAARRIDVPPAWYANRHRYASGLQHRAKRLDAFSPARRPVLVGDGVVGDQVHEGVDRRGEIGQRRSQVQGVVDPSYHRIFEGDSPSAGAIEPVDNTAAVGALMLTQYVVAFEVARAFTEKFACDTMRELHASYQAYLDLARQLPFEMPDEAASIEADQTEA